MLNPKQLKAYHTKKSHGTIQTLHKLNDQVLSGKISGDERDRRMRILINHHKKNNPHFLQETAKLENKLYYVPKVRKLN